MFLLNSSNGIPLNDDTNDDNDLSKSSSWFKLPSGEYGNEPEPEPEPELEPESEAEAENDVNNDVNTIRKQTEKIIISTESNIKFK